MQFRSLTIRAGLAGAVLGIPFLLVSGRLDRGHLNSDRLLDDIRHLSSPSMGGRGSGTAGLSKAADYISSQFSKAGVRPVAGSGYLQQFTVTTGAKLGPGNALQWTLTGIAAGLEIGRDFEPFAFSANGDVQGSPVFAGYGITACEYGYDDYAGIDVNGKIVVILRHEPQEYDSASPFEGRVYTEHAQVFSKILNAKRHGAQAVIFVNDTANHSGPDNLEKLTALPSPGGAGLPFVGLRVTVVESWFAAAGKSFAEIQSEIDKRLEPRSFAFPADLLVDMKVNVQSTPRQVANVVGYLPGETAEYIVIGAHYDHLGTGEQFSLAPQKIGTIHPGADDNASGTAGVISLARWFGGQPKMRRGIVFAAFAGEEIGLLGSTWFTTSPVLPLGNAVAMINMDMIGRMREHVLIVGGTATGDGLREYVSEAARRYPFELQMGVQAVYGSSDHTSFIAHGIPSLFFFTGLHADYHRPGDTADKIDGRNTALITELVGHVAVSLAQAPRRPLFQQVPGRPSCTTLN